MKIIVTGGAGFIGSHLIDTLLNDNHEVIVLDNYSTGRKENLEHVEDKVQILQCDISLKGDWGKLFKKVDAVFHLAALADIVPSIQNPESYFQSNVNGTFNVLYYCRKFSVNRLVYSASSSCYGIPNKYPTPETQPIDTQYPYALTKRLGEELILHWAKVYKINAVSTRFFNVYGPRSRTSGTYGAVFGVFLAQKLNNIPLTIVGNGEQTRDFTYVTDVAEALKTLLKFEISNEIFNVGSGQTISVNRIAELIGGPGYEKVFIPKRPGEPDCTFADISKIKKSIGWEPIVNIEEGVKNVLNNIEYWSNAPAWTPEKIEVETEDWFKYLK